MDDKHISLATKPGGSLHVSILHPRPREENPLSKMLVVFLNGLALPCAAWAETVDHLLNLHKDSSQPTPALLCYDRYGQGKSDSDPADIPDSPYGHDARAAVSDLHQLLIQISQDELRCRLKDLHLVLVCNSIGCVLARLYAAEHPGRVAAYLFLDSMMANTDFVSIFPNPDDPNFDETRLPGDVTADDLRHARTKFRDFFHPTVPNPEHLDRRNLREMLPHADRPALPDGPGEVSPLLTVVGHDWDEFAEQCEHGSLSVSKAVINTYMNPAWGAYNTGLTHLVQTKSTVKIAEGCGHFIQKDDPAFVAAEINSILNELQNRT
ncbi:Alpha/Beta hydrolase protein [Parachaetomium inaequale]|uniref:Alpha/Beta hydrolase protein n=1 Tax=Parachaetomium inaequale TaxID=2588326 RepID=A0AAN6SV81_9PEZI|nr:Alpha/Beta hydrolase protein [Parachaetomium inaequale]